jgi:hypothetical protein
MSDENCDIQSISITKERNVQDGRLMETEEQIKQKKNKCNILRLRLRAKCKATNRLKNKLSSGCINDGNRKAYVLLTRDYAALDVANKIGIIQMYLYII